jgi:hypothetical protein
MPNVARVRRSFMVSGVSFDGRRARRACRVGFVTSLTGDDTGLFALERDSEETPREMRLYTPAP